MATYLTGQPLFLPSVQPYQPNFQLYAGALQMKQTQYDNNRKKISNLYGSLLNAPLTRDSNAAARDEFFNTINYEIQKLAGVDLSLEENVNAASQLFTSLYDNKNIVKDMVWTKNFQNEMEAAENFRNCLDPEKCGGQYWDGGVQALEYRRQEFRNASDEEAMGFADVKYTPYVNVQEKAAKIFKEMDWNFKPIPTFSEDGAWMIQTKNGEPIVGPLLAHLQGVLGQDPQIQEYYKTKAYLDRKNFAHNNAQEYGSVEAAESVYISQTQKAINDIYSKLNAQAKEDSIAAKSKAEEIRKGQKEGYIDDSAEIQAQMDQLFGTSKKLDEFDETTSKAITSNSGVSKANLSVAGEIIDANMAMIYLNDDLTNSARILAYTDYEVDMKINPVWQMEKEHQYRMAEISYKDQLERKKAEEEATGDQMYNELFAGLTEVDPNLDPQAAYKQMREFAGSSAKNAKTTNHYVLNKVFDQSRGAWAAGGLNATQAGDDALLIMDKALNQFYYSSQHNGTKENKAKSKDWLDKWNKKSKKEKLGWMKDFNMNQLTQNMDYASIHNIYSNSIGSNGQNMFDDTNGFNKANRKYLSRVKDEIGASILDAETYYQDAKAWKDVIVNTHESVVNWLEANGSEKFRGSWREIIDPKTGTMRTQNQFAWAMAMRNVDHNMDNSPEAKVKRALGQIESAAGGGIGGSGITSADANTLFAIGQRAALEYERMSPEQKAKYKSKNDYVIRKQAEVIPDNQDKVVVRTSDGKPKYITVNEFFTEDGSVKNKYAKYADNWQPMKRNGSLSTFWTNYMEAKKEYAAGTTEAYTPGIWEQTKANIASLGNIAGYSKLMADYAKEGMENIQKDIAKKQTEMLQEYKEAYNKAPIYKGKQTFEGLMGGGSNVSTGLSQFVDYQFVQSKSVLREKDFLQNAFNSQIGSEVRVSFGKGELPKDNNPQALQLLQTLMSRALMGKKESRPTWVGEFNAIGGGNEKWQQYTITLTDPALYKTLGIGDDAQFAEFAKAGGKVTVYLKDSAANNIFYTQTKKSSFERRLDYEGTAPIAQGAFPSDFQSLRLTATPQGYNVSGNIAVDRNSDGTYMYDYLNQDYFGENVDPNSIDQYYRNILGNIAPQLNIRPNSAYPNYGGK